MQVRFKLTPDDISQGKARNCQLCPVAICIGKRFKEPPYWFSVSMDYLTVRTGTEFHKYHLIKLPQEIREFVMRFDAPDRYATPQFVKKHRGRVFTLDVPADWFTPYNESAA